MKKTFKDFAIIVLIIVFSLIFIKMCSVTVSDIDNREPLREIDNWQ